MDYVQISCKFLLLYYSFAPRVAHFPLDPQIPTIPSPFGEFFLGKNGEMGGDRDENHFQIEMGMGRHPPSPFVEMVRNVTFFS